MRWEKTRMKRERENGLTSLSQALSVLPSCLVTLLSCRDGWNSLWLQEVNQKMNVVTTTKVTTLVNQADNPPNQSKLEANTSSWHEARENVCKQVTFGFCFTPDWLAKWREFFSQSRSAEVQNESRSTENNCKTTVASVFYFETPLSDRVYTSLYAGKMHFEFINCSIISL